MNIGLNFRKLREQLGLTQLELSKKLKTHQMMISRYESNKRNPSYKIIKRLLELSKKEGLSYTWDDFREYEEEKKTKEYETKKKES